MPIRQFSLLTVIRMVPKELLVQCFLKLKWDDRDLSYYYQQFSQRSLVSLFQERFPTLPREQQDLIEGVMRTFSDLASESGCQAMRDAAVHCGVPDLMTQIPYDLCVWGRAAWVWLHHPKVTERAQIINQIDHLPWWRRRDDLPRMEPKTSEQDLQKLAKKISREFLLEGRGKECTVQHLPKGTVDLFFAFPDDFIKCFTVHDKEGRLAAAAVRDTVLVIFKYDRVKGTLELCAKLPKRAKAVLEYIFADAILDVQLRGYRPKPFRFDKLKEPSFTFPVDPADHIRAGLCKMRIQPPGFDTSLSVQVPDWNRGTDFRASLQKCLNLEAIPFSEWYIAMIELYFEFLPTENRKSKVVLVDVAYPRSLNIRDDCPERIELIRKYLGLWGIESGGSVGTNLGAVA